MDEKSKGSNLHKGSLSMYQAATCETAREPVCKCRCGGALHGARRGGELAGGKVDTSFFEGLPEDDPHHVTPEVVRAERSRERRVSRNVLKTSVRKAAAARQARERFQSLVAAMQGHQSVRAHAAVQPEAEALDVQDAQIQDVQVQDVRVEEEQAAHAH